MCVFSQLLSHVWLCDPMDCNLPGSSVHGVFQARIPECVAVSFSRGFSRPRDWTQISWIADRFVTIWSTSEALNNEVTPKLNDNTYCHYFFFSREWDLVPQPGMEPVPPSVETRWTTREVSYYYFFIISPGSGHSLGSGRRLSLTGFLQLQSNGDGVILWALPHSQTWCWD